MIAMARDQQRDRVAPERAADRARGARRPDPSRDLAVARGLAPAHAADRAQDALVEGGPVAQVDGDVATPSAGSPARSASIVGIAASRTAAAGSPGAASVSASVGTRSRAASSAANAARRSRQLGSDDPRARRGDVERAPPPSSVAMTTCSTMSESVHQGGAGVPGGWYTPREYGSTTADRRDPAPHRGHDLRLVRQPHRALPARRPTASRRPSVNLATEVATIRYLPDVADRAALVGAIEAAGYDVRPAPARATTPTPHDACRGAPAEDAERAREARDALLVEAVVSIGVALGIMVAMFVPQTPVPMETINRLALVPATFIQVWAGRRFYRAAWRAARHGTANMDTLDRGRHDRGVGLQRRS